MGKKRIRRCAQQWQSLVEKQHDSGLSAPAFCKAQGIAYQSFMTWQKRVTKSCLPAAEPESPFIELTASAGTKASESTSRSSPVAALPMPMCVELSLGAGIELRITRTV